MRLRTWRTPRPRRARLGGPDAHPRVRTGNDCSWSGRPFRLFVGHIPTYEIKGAPMPRPVLFGSSDLADASVAESAGPGACPARVVPVFDRTGTFNSVMGRINSLIDRVGNYAGATWNRCLFWERLSRNWPNCADIPCFSPCSREFGPCPTQSSAEALRLIGDELMTAESEASIPDRRLALMFACAHPGTRSATSEVSNPDDQPSADRIDGAPLSLPGSMRRAPFDPSNLRSDSSGRLAAAGRRLDDHI